MDRLRIAPTTGAILLVLLVQGARRDQPELEPLVGNLTSEDAKTAGDARQTLESMGPEVVPVLFEKLLTADWTLRPRLLEVLAAKGNMQ